MKLLNAKIASLLALIIFVMNLEQACAAGPKNAAAAPTLLEQSYTWYDGKQERHVWLDPSLIAEFNVGVDKAVQGTVKSVFGDAELVSKHYGTVKLWKLGASSDIPSAVKALTEANLAGKYSQVFHDGPTTSGRMRALPGNIIVYLNPTWDASAVDAWLSENKLEVVRKLDVGPNIYVIKTSAGLDALNTANKLYQSGQVIAAIPDWWIEVTAR